MIHFGIGYVGILYLLMLFTPNIIWTRNKPKNYEAYVGKENPILVALERIGEILVCWHLVCFADVNPRRTWWAILLCLSFLLMLLYEAFWIRYFRSEKTMRDYYGDFCKIPVAGATLPVCAVFLLGLYACNAPLLLSDILLGIGHIGIHLAHRDEAFGRRKRTLPAKIGRGILLALCGLLVLGSLGIVAARNFHYLDHFQIDQDGVDEAAYLPLGDQDQYVLMRGKDRKNPVIIYLHGGPSSPDTYTTYAFSRYLLEDYTFIAWDQRGCGRTYLKNKGEDPANETASFDQALEDLDQLVEYARDRFHQKKVILLGHSYGTILGFCYAEKYPQKVSAYIGAGQVVSLDKMDFYSYEDALEKAKAAGDDTSALLEGFQAYQDNPGLPTLLALRERTQAYHPVEKKDKGTQYAITSPYFGIDDLRWFLKQLGNAEEYLTLNKQLFDYTLGFDAYAHKKGSVPTLFLCGEDDWICPLDSIRDYAKTMDDSKVSLKTLPGAGHYLQYTFPEDFARAIREFLEE